MAWYRLALAKYDDQIARRRFAQTAADQVPKFISLETSKEPPDFSAVSLIYYIDAALSEECGDFFFTSLEEALTWSEETLGISRDSYEMFDPPMSIQEFE